MRGSLQFFECLGRNLTVPGRHFVVRRQRCHFVYAEHGPNSIYLTVLLSLVRDALVAAAIFSHSARQRGRESEWKSGELRESVASTRVYEGPSK